ncbi:hypothetical protein [Thalassobacillus hwangdonensis]|uniref:AtpZ/AtpI family protein n=1 Tax=Thalassobacillus hwangdonensis TaxID=546108 RepID=A0ABW3L4E8_9BACI
MKYVKVNLLIGTLIGFSIVFLIRGLWTGDFDFSWWIGMLLGGVFAYFLLALVFYLRDKGADRNT